MASVRKYLFCPQAKKKKCNLLVSIQMFICVFSFIIDTINRRVDKNKYSDIAHFADTKTES